MKMISIAIDGPSGAGKSTMARKVAAELNYLYVDTGAIYRSVSLYAYRAGVDKTDSEKIVSLLPEIHIDMQYQADGIQHMILNGEDVTERIRLPELTPAGRYVITERDLDRNEHTNNCRYADIVAGVLDRKEAIRRFLIHYAKETRLHDEIQLFQASTEDGRIVVGKLPDGVTVFTAKVS